MLQENGLGESGASGAVLRTGGQPTRRGSADDADEEGGGLGHVGYLVSLMFSIGSFFQVL